MYPLRRLRLPMVEYHCGIQSSFPHTRRYIFPLKLILSKLLGLTQIIHKYLHHYHQSVLPKGNLSLPTHKPRLQFSPKAGLPLQTQKPRFAVLLGINRCGTFPLLSAPHSLFSVWSDLKRSEKIPGAPTWRWGKWIWLTEPSGLHRNSPQGLNISSIWVFGHIRDPEIPITLLSPF